MRTIQYKFFSLGEKPTVIPSERYQERALWFTISFRTLATEKSHKTIVTRVFMSTLHVFRKSSTRFSSIQSTT